MLVYNAKKLAKPIFLNKANQGETADFTSSIYTSLLI